MKLMTKEIENKLLKNPLYSHENEPDPEVIVKYFSPVGAATWLITEGEKQPNGDWMLFGYCTLGYEWEWGYVSLNELEKIKLPYGLTIERDLYSHGKVSELAK